MAVTDVLFSGLVTVSASGDSVATPQTDSAGRTGVFNFSGYRTLAVFVQVKSFTGGTSPTVQVILDSGDGQAFPGSTYWAHLNGTAPNLGNGANTRTSIGPGTSNNDQLATLGRFIWNLAGGPSACSFYLHIEGQR